MLKCPASSGRREQLNIGGPREDRSKGGPVGGAESIKTPTEATRRAKGKSMETNGKTSVGKSKVLIAADKSVDLPLSSQASIVQQSWQSP